MNRTPDVLVVGAGIVGVACARALVREGFAVDVIDARPPGEGTTASGMGHLVVLDDSSAQFSLSRRSVQAWRQLRDQLPREVEFQETGTLWIAESESQAELAMERLALFRSAKLRAHWVDADELRRLEPELAQGLAGGLLVRDDAVLYPPSATRWLLQEARDQGARFRRRRVRSLGQGGVRLDDGTTLQADVIVNATGLAAIDLMPALSDSVRRSLRLRPKKGQLVISDRAPGFCRHQLVEFGYLESAHGDEKRSVAFNLQPRRNGQMLLGSSREVDVRSREIDQDLMAGMLARAQRFLPRLDRLRALRAWTGVRALSGDGLPLIGPTPDDPTTWLATGHEGLGITTALVTAELISDGIRGVAPAIDPKPYLPSRFLDSTSHRHAG